MHTFHFPAPTEAEPIGDTVAAIFATIDERYLPNKNVTQATAIFNACTAELQQEAGKCDFGDKHDRLLGGRIIIGIHDAALRERLFRERNLTTVHNLNHKHSKQTRRQNSTTPRRQPPPQQRNGENRNTAFKKTACSRCGTMHQPRHCPAYGSTCYAWGKFGHYASVCRQKQWHGPRQVRMLDND